MRFLSHFQNESYNTYNNCLPESSYLENPSVLMGWWSGIGMASTCEKTTHEIAPIGAISRLWHYIFISDKNVNT